MHIHITHSENIYTSHIPSTNVLLSLIHIPSIYIHSHILSTYTHHTFWVHIYITHSEYKCTALTHTYSEYIYHRVHIFITHSEYICTSHILTTSVLLSLMHIPSTCIHSSVPSTHTHHTFQVHIPLTEEIRLQKSGSRDLSVFSIEPLSDGDSVYSTEKVFRILGTPMKTCLICMGTPVKTCSIFWQS